MPGPPGHFSPYEVRQFVHRCRRCGQLIRRTSMPGGWQGRDAMFTCFTGDLPTRADLGRKHQPIYEETDQ